MLCREVGGAAPSSRADAAPCPPVPLRLQGPRQDARYCPAVVAQRNLCSTARIEDVKHGAIGNRLTGTLLDSFGQQTFELSKVGNFRTHILQVARGDRTHFAA